MKKREMDLIKKYDTPETVCVVTSYPDRSGESAERNAIANYSRELVREMGKEVKVVIIAEVLDKPRIYEEDGVLIVRAFWRDSIFMNWQIVRATALFKQAKQVLLQFEFGVYGGSMVTFLTSLFGLLTRITGKKLTVMMHQVTGDLGELCEHLGIAHRGVKTWALNLGMRLFYLLTGLISDKILVHNKYLAQKLSHYVLKEKIAIVPHGVGMRQASMTRDVARRALGWQRNEFVIIAFGYLSWYKGSDWVIKEVGEIAKKYPNKRIKLVMAGGESGTLKEMTHYQTYVKQLRQLAREYKIEITGYVHDRDKGKFFVGADLIVLPHRVAMSESGVMAHVAMYGKPFLASRPRTTSLLDQQLITRVGFDFEDHSFEKKLNAMIKSKKLRGEVGEAVAKQGRDHSWEKVAQMYLVALPYVGRARYTGAKYDTQVAI